MFKVNPIDWDRAERIRRAHGKTWGWVAERIGVSEPRLSDIRSGRKPYGIKFMCCYLVGMELEWGEGLKELPKLNGAKSGREALGIHTMEDDRPWAVKYGRQEDYTEQKRRTNAAYLRWQREKEAEEHMAAWLGGA